MVSVDSRPPARSGEATPTPASGMCADRAGLLLAIAIGFLVGARPIADNSFLTHLATGRLIVETGSVPSVDPYSYTAHGDPWVVQSWLVSLIYAQLENVGGLIAIRCFHGLLMAAVLAGIWRFTRPSDRIVVRLSLLGLAVVVLAQGTGPRPLLVGLLGVVLVRGGQAGWFRPWLMVPVGAVWVNSHGSFPLAIAILGCAGLVELVWRRRLDGRTLQMGVAALVGIVGGAFAGPLDQRILIFPIELLSRSEVLSEVIEWAPWSLAGWSGVGFGVAAVLLCVAAGRGMTLPDGVVAAAVTVTGFMAIRNIPAATVLIVAAVAPAMRMRWGSISSDTRGPAVVALVVCAVAMSIVSAAGFLGRSFIDDAYPVAEVDWLAERELVAEPTVNLLTGDTTGNYLEVRFGASARVFTDDRFDFYPVEFQEQFHYLLAAGPYEPALESWDVDVVLWPTHSGLTRWLDESEDWLVIHLPDAVGPDGEVPELSKPTSVACRQWLADRCR